VSVRLGVSGISLLAAYGIRMLRDVDLEDGHDADLEDVWAVENPAGWVRRGWVVLRVSRAVLRVSR